MIIKEERIAGQRLILGDGRAVFPSLEGLGAVVTDPPYGIKAAKGVGKYGRERQASATAWDDEAADLGFLAAQIAGACPVSICGGNYFDLPPSMGVWAWDKCYTFKGRDFSEFELCWTNTRQAARLFVYDSKGNGDLSPQVKVHPTQKPTEVMCYALDFLARKVPIDGAVVDPFMGVGSTLIACQKRGLSGIGIEIDSDYFDHACRRVDEASRQPSLL